MSKVEPIFSESFLTWLWYMKNVIIAWVVITTAFWLFTPYQEPVFENYINYYVSQWEWIKELIP